MKSLKQFLKEDALKLDLTSIFHKLNGTMFGHLDGGALPNNIPIVYGKLPKGVVGQTLAQSMKGSGGKVFVPGTLKIIIADLSFEESKLKQVVAHELIHAYLMFNNNFQDNHGPVFKKMANDLSRKLGFEIPLSHSFSADELAEFEIKPVCALIFKKNGQKYIGLWSHKLAQNITPDMESIIKAHTSYLSPPWEDGWFGTIDTTLHSIMKVQKKSPFDGLSYSPLPPEKEKAILNKTQLVYYKRQ